MCKLSYELTGFPISHRQLSVLGSTNVKEQGGEFVFALNISSIFGKTIDCRINGKSKRVTWRDEHTLVIEADPYATGPIDTEKFGANWKGLETVASQLRGNCTAKGISGSANVVADFKNRSDRSSRLKIADHRPRRHLFTI
jgi:hypothetical protein